MKEKHIFIIESEVVSRLDLRLQLESMGYIIHWDIPFANLNEELRKLKPDLIIINFDACRQESFPFVQETLSQQQIPIIYVGVNNVADTNIDSSLNIVGAFLMPYITEDVIKLAKRVFTV